MSNMTQLEKELDNELDWYKHEYCAMCDSYDEIEEERDHQKQIIEELNQEVEDLLDERVKYQKQGYINELKAVRLTDIFYSKKDIFSKKDIYETYCYFLRKLESRGSDE